MDLFSDQVIKRVTGIAGRLDEDKSCSLQAALRDVAFHFMTALYSTPLRLSGGPDDVKLFARVQHLERQILKPADRLIEALSDNKLPLLSEWPEEIQSTAPNREALIAELTKLRDRAEELRDQLADRLPEENMTTEFLIDLGNALTKVLKDHFPQLAISRGTYDKGSSSEVGKMRGRFLDVMDICIAEILPNDGPLSSNLVGQLRKLRGP